MKTKISKTTASLTLLFLVGLLEFCPLAQAELYNDEGVHNLLDGTYGEIYVDNPPPAAPAFTTVNFGGTASADYLGAFNNSRVTMDDGNIWGNLDAYDNSNVTMNGGNFYLELDVSGDSQVTMNGGNVYDCLHVSGNSRMTIRGGSIIIWWFYTGGRSVVTIVGSDFAVYSDPLKSDLVFSGYGDLTSSFNNCFLWGTLASGDPLTGLELSIYSDGCVSLVPVPKVAVDIKPGSCPNPLNVKSKGIFPVAILGTKDFDVTNIDVASIYLEGISPIRSAYEDAATPVVDSNDCNCAEEGPDSYLDLVLKFKTQEIVNTVGEVSNGDVLELELTGVLFDKTPIKGSDCVIIRGNH